MLNGDKGAVILWSGAIVDIPAGWALCDGTNDTPDLTDKFVVGSGSTYVDDETGGNGNHRHFLTTDGHIHTNESPRDQLSGTLWENDLSNEVMTADSNNTSNLPLFHSLVYIMKL